MLKTGTRGRTDYARDHALIRSGWQWSSLIIALCLAIILPLALRWTHNGSWLNFLNYSSIIIIGVLGLNVITGMTGQISMGHSAFLMAGGYVMGILGATVGMNFWVSLLAATLITGLLGIIVACPAIRLRGFYVTIATLAFFYLAQFIIRILPFAGGIHGIIGVPVPTFGFFNIKDDLSWYYFLLFFVIVACLASANITRSRLGKSFITVRDNEIAAKSLGINVPLTKLRGFFVGSLFAGLAGALAASYVSVIRIDQFSVWDSIWFLGMICIGGAGSTTGAVMGVLFLRLISQILHVIGASDFVSIGSNFFTYITFAVYGLVIILFMSFQPNGLLALWQKFRINYKRWPFGV